MTMNSFKQMKLYLIIGALPIVVCSGCTSVEIVKQHYEPEKGGILRYSGTNADLGSAQSSARQKALLAGRKFCHGPIRVLQEGQRFDEHSQPSVQQGQDLGYLFLQFRCAVQGRKLQESVSD